MLVLRSSLSTYYLPLAASAPPHRPNKAPPEQAGRCIIKL